MDSTAWQDKIRQSFDAAETYEDAAIMQRMAARRLFACACEKLAGRTPTRILELGCGTGFLTQLLHEQWPNAELIATDIAPQMLVRAARRVGDGVTFQVQNAAAPDVQGHFDLICGNLVFQWLEQPKAALAQLAGLLAPSGVLALSTLQNGTFAEWHAACAPHTAGTPQYLTPAAMTACVPPFCSGLWVRDAVVQPFESALAFLRHLKHTGAAVPHAGYKPLNGAALRQAMARFDSAGCYVTWQLAYGCFQRPARAGVFVTGTDTGVGKTFISACLVKAWHALYWKPLQSGLADEAGDTPTVRYLAGCKAEDIIAPAGAYLAPLSPEAAAAAEGCVIDPETLSLPQQQPQRPLIVEGAGGLMVPVTERLMMVDLAVQWGLPVVLVARSGLGTLNHTLLSIEALRARGVCLLGVVLNGPLNPENSKTIQEKGQVRILAEVPQEADISAQTVQRIAQTLPQWERLAKE